MRVEIVHPGAGELHYEIREIVKFAQKIARSGVPIVWENIGDPVAKNESIPQWICDIIAKEIHENLRSYAYSPTKGLLETRQFLSRVRAEETGAELRSENIMFFNGLGDAVTKLYTWLHPTARVLGPDPAYPTHSSLEGAHGNSPMVTYKLDPNNNWWPDVEDVRKRVQYNPSIAALLIINPDNPTGMVYPREILEEFANIAREHQLFLISDEIYAGLAYDESGFVSLPEIAGDVPAIVMRGLSKEVPWPGSRCGWLEFYNIHKDTAFARYIQSIEEAKMNEVCSTTLPQAVLPKIFADIRYQEHLRNRRIQYENRADRALRYLNGNSSLRVVKPKGSFYLTVTFSDDFAKSNFSLAAANPSAQRLLDNALAGIDTNSFDKRFCYQLLAATGICVVPLTAGFNSYVPGFRMTLLETDDHKFAETLQTITDVVS